MFVILNATGVQESPIGERIRKGPEAERLLGVVRNVFEVGEEHNGVLVKEIRK